MQPSILTTLASPSPGGVTGPWQPPPAWVAGAASAAMSSRNGTRAAVAMDRRDIGGLQWIVVTGTPLPRPWFPPNQIWIKRYAPDAPTVERTTSDAVSADAPCITRNGRRSDAGRLTFLRWFVHLR